MKKLYIIVPLVLLVAFIFLYMDFSKKHAALEIQHAEEAAMAKKEEDARKAAAERASREESARRTAEREAEAAAKEAARRKQWEEAGARLAEETRGYKMQADAHSKRVNELEIELLEIRRQKDAESEEALALAEKVELARIAKRNAELEVQRLNQMLAQRAAESALAQMPPPPPAAAAKR